MKRVKFWSDAEIAYCLNNQQLGFQILAEKLGRTPKSIIAMLTSYRAYKKNAAWVFKSFPSTVKHFKTYEENKYNMQPVNPKTNGHVDINKIKDAVGNLVEAYIEKEVSRKMTEKMDQLFQRLKKSSF